MSNLPSATTKPLALRLPNKIYVILERRANKQGKKVSDYLRARVIYDTCRSHKRNVREYLEKTKARD